MPTGLRDSEGCRFRPIEFHARGGQGEVWIARDTELNREVALKRLRDDHADNPWSRVRFVHEAEVTGALEHRGIAPVYGRGYFEDGRPYYAMRFIGGTSLKKAIETFHAEDPSTQGTDERSLELRRLLGRFVDACNTVAYAHSRGVIHRDLKPDNIILDEYGETLVVDWGLAKSGCGGGESLPGEAARRPVSASALPSTETGDIMGTLYFMSPEQAGGGSSEVGPSTDVYSLGATLYCLLTGKAPFEGSDTASILEKVSTGEFPRPRAGPSERTRRARGDLPEGHGARSRRSLRHAPRPSATTSSDGWPINPSRHTPSHSRPGPCVGFDAASNGSPRRPPCWS